MVGKSLLNFLKKNEGARLSLSYHSDVSGWWRVAVYRGDATYTTIPILSDSNGYTTPQKALNALNVIAADRGY